MSTKKISAGDTLTVGDLTDAHRGAVIEVGPEEGITSRMRLKNVVRGIDTATVYADDGGFVDTFKTSPVTVITPPTVVQPDEPKVLGQCIRIEGDDDWLGVVADPHDDLPIRDTEEGWWDWDLILERAGDRRIIVSDPPCWPDETPEADETSEVPKRIEAGEWPDDDKRLRGLPDDPDAVERAAKRLWEIIPGSPDTSLEELRDQRLADYWRSQARAALRAAMNTTEKGEEA